MSNFIRNLFSIAPDWQTFIAILGGYGVFEIIAGKNITNPNIKSIIIVLISFLAPLLAFTPANSNNSWSRIAWALIFATLMAITQVILRLFSKFVLIQKSSLDKLNDQISKLVEVKIGLEKKVDNLSGEIEEIASFKISFNRDVEFRLIDEQVEIIDYHYHTSEICPSVEQALDYLLDRMMTTVLYTAKPEQFRVCIAQPLPQGRFRVLASRNTLFERIVEIQKDANWSRGISLFASGVYSTEPLVKFSNIEEHYNFKLPYDGYKQSEVHLIIPICNEKHVHTDVYERCLAVLTIGALDKRLLLEHSLVINNLQPQLQGIRRILNIYRNAS